MTFNFVYIIVIEYLTQVLADLIYNLEHCFPGTLKYIISIMVYLYTQQKRNRVKTVS